MAFSEVETRPDGSLYCDISIEKLGFPSYTSLCSLPIRYDGSKFEEMGQIFVSLARSTCPVDTGFLRDHNDYKADLGGIEMWSEATYSAYQEYGTSRCRAQPWFEASVQSALSDSGIEEDFASTQARYAYIDGELSAIQNSYPMTLYECESLIIRIENLQMEMDALGINVDGLDEELDYLQMEIESMMIQLMVTEMTNPAEASALEQIIISLIVGMIMAIVRFIIDSITDFNDVDLNPHNPSH